MSSFTDLLARLTGTLNGWLTAAVAWAPRLVVGLLVAAVFFGLAHLVRRSVSKALERTRVSPTLYSMVARGAQFLVMLVGLMATLDVLQLDEAVTSLLAGAGVVGLALGFAFQDLAANLISGVGLSVRRPFTRGDVIECNDVLGVAEQIQLRTTLIRTFDGKKVRVPNRTLYQNVLVNHSATDSRRVDVACGVAYDSDLEQVKRVGLEALEGVACRVEDQEPELFFDGFGGSSIDFEARVWIPFESQRDYLAARDEIIMALKAAFDAHEIEIPFPIRTLELGDSARRALGPGSSERQAA